MIPLQRYRQGAPRRSNDAADTIDAVKRRTVLLQHDLPDGSHHLDWLLDLNPAADAPLTTFRLASPVYELPADRRIPAQRIADHRRRYLEYEGPISGNRGSVRRIAAGIITDAENRPHELLLTTHWTTPEDFTQNLRLTPDADAATAPAAWIVFCISQMPANHAQ